MTEATNTPPSSGWTIIGQVQQKQLNQSNQFVDGVQVSFTTGHGVSGSVFVPYAGYNPTNVAAMVGERAAQLDAIATLSAPDMRN